MARCPGVARRGVADGARQSLETRNGRGRGACGRVIKRECWMGSTEAVGGWGQSAIVFVLRQAGNVFSRVNCGGIRETRLSWKVKIWENLERKLTEVTKTARKIWRQGC